MRIAYIDAGINKPSEDYSINSLGYGGAACFARYAKVMLNNQKDQFFIFGSAENFKNIPNEENILNCIILREESWAAIRNGAPIKDYIPEAETFDIFCFHHDCFFLNTEGLKGKQVHWSLMSCPRSGHPRTPYHLMYSPGSQCNYGKSYPIVIGKYVSDNFVSNLKEDLIFNCGRNDSHFNTIETAKFCLKEGIKGIFAGPILDSYPILDFIDNKTTFYIGLINEKEKLNWFKKARVSTYLHTWDTAFNLSAVESLSVGTPILAAKRGCFNYLLQEGSNGYYWDGSNLAKIYEKAVNLDQVKVWESAKPYSHKAMVDSFYKAFEQILNEN